MEELSLTFDFKKVLALRLCDTPVIIPPSGTLPSNTQQNKLLGAPFVLTSSMVNVLKENKLITTKDDESMRPRTFKEKVYSDLLSHGYAVLDGLKYGVDYAVYMGDPLVVHGFFLVKVLQSSIDAMEFIRLNRLARCVLKKLILAMEVDGTISYVELSRSAVQREPF